ncbi:MAG: redoxin family protein [Lewinellaceae bacterium]|nr:redoxin family protein [Lewinellaceae bacterium]
MKKRLLLPVLLLFCQWLPATPAPDFTVTTSDGQTRHLYQDYVNQQKIIVLEIFFTTCPPCATHAPYLQNLYQTVQAGYPGQVEFMLLSDKVADTDPLVASYLTGKGLTMPAAGSDGGSLAAVQPYKNGNFGLFQGTPTFVVIEPGTGEVYFDLRGNSPQETMDLLSQKIAELLPEEDCFLRSYFDNPIDSVLLNVQTVGGFDTSFYASGAYSLLDISELQAASYTVTPVKSGDPLQGLSTYDLVKIASHILNIVPFDAPWQSIAADMNCSNSVTTFDIVEGRRIILGMTTGFAGCGGAVWRFVPEPDGTPGNGSCLNFRGVKLGDVTGPYFAPDDKVDDRQVLGLRFARQQLEAGRRYKIPVITGNPAHFLGLQLAFGVEKDAIRILSVESSVLSGFDEQAYNLSEQMGASGLPVVWVGSQGAVDLLPGEQCFVLEIEALQNANLADVLYLHSRLSAEAYREDGSIVLVNLREGDTPGQVSIAPNPAKGLCHILYNAGKDGEVRIQLTDLRGVLVYESIATVTKGANSLPIRPSACASGLYLVKLNGQPAGKLIWQP